MWSFLILCRLPLKSVFCAFSELPRTGSAQHGKNCILSYIWNYRGIGWSFRYMNSSGNMILVLPSSLSNLLPNPFPNKIHLPQRSKIKMATFVYFRQQTLKSPLTHNICMLPTADINPDLTHNICMFSTMEFLLTDTYFHPEKLPIFCVG